MRGTRRQFLTAIAQYAGKNTIGKNNCSSLRRRGQFQLVGAALGSDYARSKPLSPLGLDCFRP